MTIELRCSQCDTLLRVPDSSLGKKARCPRCEAITEVVNPATETAATETAATETAAAEVAAANPFAEQSENLYQSPQEAGGPDPNETDPAGSQLQPHRGQTVQILRIFGLVFIIGNCLCLILPINLALSIPAWLMGRKDLDEIAAGRMDPSGEGMTKAGMIMGIAGTILGVLAIMVLWLAIML